MIEINELSKIFWDTHRGEVRAVDSISFTCSPGEIFGLLGANGAGKTTTLRMLSTVLQPTQGQAKIAGFDVSTQPQKVRQQIGFISGSTGIYERMTPREMVAFFGRLYGMSEDRIESRTQEIFAQLQMESFANTLNSKLSTGMRQKVSIARTIIHDPPVLVFDEPTTALDIMVARTVLQFIATCRDQGKCIVLSTHIMREAEKLCNRIGILHEGRLIAVGSLDELCRQTGKADLEDAFFTLAQSQEVRPA